MEEQTLPWWKRALRAAIGTLRSGFGLFGKPQQEVAVAAPVEMHEAAVIDLEPVAEPVNEPEPEIETAEIVELKEEEIEAELPDELVEEVAMPESIETSEPEMVVVSEAEIEEVVVEESEPEIEIEEVAVEEPEPEIEDVAVEEPEAEEAIEEVAIPASEDRTTADPSTTPSTRVTRSGFAQDDTLLEEQAAQDEKQFEEQEVVEIEPEPATQSAVSESEAVEEWVEVQEVEEEIEPENIAVETTEPAEEELEIDEPVVEETEAVVEPEVAVEQESVHEVTMETVPEAAEEVEQIEEVSDIQQEAGTAESIPAEDEIEEMTPLHEERFPEPESANPESPETDSPDVEAEQEAAQVSEQEAEVSSVEASAEAEAEPVQTAAAAEPEAAPAEPHMIKHVIKEDDDKSSPFSIIVSQVYEGPMDLLLDLIRKQDIDIYDIPIAKITEQFLAYVERLRASDMDMAGEFIYTASLLIHIKSKTLLPRAPSGPDDQYDDPRRELVERLLEHERFKNAAQMLQQKQMIEDATWTNPGSREFKGDTGTEPELAADTVDLVRIFREILDRARNRPVINVEEDAVTVGQMIQFLGRRLNMEDRPIALRKLLAHTHSQRALVAMFLALLELVRLQAILLRQDKLFSEIFIKKHEGFDNVMTEGFLAARDDWN